MKGKGLVNLILKKVKGISKGSALYLSQVEGIEELLQKKELPPNPEIRTEFRNRGPGSELWYRKRMIGYLSCWIIIEDPTFSRTTYEVLADYCERKVKKE